MARGPSCCLYLSFLVQFSSMAALLAGYSTPYWTRLKMSTGEVRSLGIVVSCDMHKCDMLNVTGSRGLFIIIFGMFTSCILLSLLTIQVLCLALCNKSCREKNVGTCLSYLSLLTAFMIGGSLGLYHIDLKDEDKPDVMRKWMDWSQYCVMAACGGFFLGTWLDAWDHCIRDRSRRRELIKRAEIKAKVVTHANGHGPRPVETKNYSTSNNSHATSTSDKRRQYAGRDGWRAAASKSKSQGQGHRDPRICSTVESAMTLAKSRGELQRGRGNRSTTVKPGVREGGEDSRRISDRSALGRAATQVCNNAQKVKSINVREAPTATVNVSNTHYTKSASLSEPTARERRREGGQEISSEYSELSSKYRLERSNNVNATGLDERILKLPVLQEENKVPTTREDLVLTKPLPEKRVLTRQETKTLVGRTIMESTDIVMGDNSQKIKRGQHDETVSYSRSDRRRPTVEDILPKPDVSNKRDNIPTPTSHHTKPHPLQRDGQINSNESINGSKSKLKPNGKIPSLEDPDSMPHSRSSRPNPGKSLSVDLPRNGLSHLPPSSSIDFSKNLADLSNNNSQKSTNSTKTTHKNGVVVNSSSTSLGPLSGNDDQSSFTTEANKSTTRQRRIKEESSSTSKTDSGSLEDTRRTKAAQGSRDGVKKGSVDKGATSADFRHSLNNGDVTEEQLKRLQIVENMMNAKKDRKKKRITQ